MRKIIFFLSLLLAMCTSYRSIGQAVTFPDKENKTTPKRVKNSKQFAPLKSDIDGRKTNSKNVSGAIGIDMENSNTVRSKQELRNEIIVLRKEIKLLREDEIDVSGLKKYLKTLKYRKRIMNKTENTIDKKPYLL